MHILIETAASFNMVAFAHAFTSISLLSRPEFILQFS